MLTRDRRGSGDLIFHFFGCQGRRLQISDMLEDRLVQSTNTHRELLFTNVVARLVVSTVVALGFGELLVLLFSLLLLLLYGSLDLVGLH